MGIEIRRIGGENRDDMFRCLYLDDLKVKAACRGQGVGKRRIEASRQLARERGCLFYLRCGFEIGGFDNRVYRGTSQADRANILFYLDG